VDWKYLLTSYKGRINRTKFWAGVAVVMAIMGAYAALLRTLGLNGLDASSHFTRFLARSASTFVFGLAVYYIALAVFAKRWHDRGKTGWWSLIAIVPVIGCVWILVELGILEGDRGANQYGPDPLA